ncbi:hypothetical protein BC351_34160 [Paenibacillus ferrarius]|uniref:Uncharacterized protein n=1 Tax=Paenibacillus ferrarius TaxID=1469647 RepID=A0A1V4HDS0_9BACL|nr:hypothetical protein BC351_34160 [Paenibacillus ferrarius]
MFNQVTGSSAKLSIIWCRIRSETDEANGYRVKSEELKGVNKVKMYSKGIRILIGGVFKTWWD